MVAQTDLAQIEQKEKQEETFILQAWQVLQHGDQDMDGTMTRAEFAAARQSGALQNVSDEYLKVIDDNFDTIVDLSDDEFFGDSGISRQDLGMVKYGGNNLTYGHFGRQNALDNEETAVFTGIVLGLLAEGAVWLTNPKRALCLHLGGAVAGAASGFYDEPIRPGASVGESVAIKGIAGGLGYAALFTTGLALYGTSQAHKSYWESYVKPDIEKLYTDMPAVP